VIERPAAPLIEVRWSLESDEQAAQRDVHFGTD